MSPIRHSYHVLRRPVGARQRPKLHIGPLAVDGEHVCYRDTDISAVRQAYDREEGRMYKPILVIGTRTYLRTGVRQGGRNHRKGGAWVGGWRVEGGKMSERDRQVQTGTRRRRRPHDTVLY